MDNKKFYRIVFLGYYTIHHNSCMRLLVSRLPSASIENMSQTSAGDESWTVRLNSVDYKILKDLYDCDCIYIIPLEEEEKEK